MLLEQVTNQCQFSCSILNATSMWDQAASPKIENDKGTWMNSLIGIYLSDSIAEPNFTIFFFFDMYELDHYR